MVKNKLSRILQNLILLALLLNLQSCNTSEGGNTKADEIDINYSALSNVDDWEDSTHGKLDSNELIDNLDIIFDLDTVQKIRIVIEKENWDLMDQNLSELKRELNGSRDFSSVENPIFVPSEVFYNGTEWYKVGIRFKGNSSLYSVRSGKLSFKLDFDEFEDEYPVIDDQRFFGFKQLNLKNNYKDESEMREVIVAELFRDFGLTSARASFYEVYINNDGSGDEANDIYYGLYTLVEEVDDTVIETQYYNNDDGNLYKPDGDAASFESGTYDEDEFGLQTDDDSYADILELYERINKSSYATGSDEWIAALDEVFDIDTFLKWLAANSVMQNWDTYGVMTHNFFLYNNPETGKFEWIPWDGNEALESNRRCLPLSMSSVRSDWPLISSILANSSCEARYKSYVADFADTLFNESRMTSIYNDYESLIYESVNAEGSRYSFIPPGRFASAVDYLLNHVAYRNSAANSYAGID